MLKLYDYAAPNSMKVVVLLEKLELPFEVATIDIFKGEQHAPEFRKVNPNTKVPAITDDGVTVFDSHEILLYLAEKHPKFLPQDRVARAASAGFIFGEKGLAGYSNVARLLDGTNTRAAFVRALQLKDNHTFKTELDEQAYKVMFPQNVVE